VRLTIIAIVKLPVTVLNNLGIWLDYKILGRTA